MRTKNCFRIWILLWTLPTLLMTTSCSYDVRLTDDDVVQVQKGYQFPVTLNTSSQTQITRASYNTETMRLRFNTGDHLLVAGTHAKAGRFAGELVWLSGVMFQGFIYTEKEFTGTAYNLLEEATTIGATLLPHDYCSYGYLSISGTGYGICLNYPTLGNAFADTKAHGVEQLSFIHSDCYANGFALAPGNAIISFTVNGLTPDRQYTFITTDGTSSPSGSVTTDSTGQATFTVAFTPEGNAKNYSIQIGDGTEYHDLSTGLRIMEAGCIYSIRLTASERR